MFLFSFSFIFNFCHFCFYLVHWLSQCFASSVKGTKRKEKKMNVSALNVQLKNSTHLYAQQSNTSRLYRNCLELYIYVCVCMCVTSPFHTGSNITAGKMEIALHILYFLFFIWLCFFFAFSTFNITRQLFSFP